MAYFPPILHLDQSRSGFIMYEDEEDDDQMVNNGVAPLSFDRAYNGHITTSRFPLFRMPVELFEHVTRWLSRRDLQALGLVDRDCCKLAALTLFKKVQVEQLPLPSTLSPLASILMETELEKGNSTPYNGSPSNFVACVRQIVIRPNKVCSVNGGVNNRAMSRDGYKGDILFLSGYTMPFNRIFSSTFANLHTLHWDGPSFSTSDIMRCLFYLPLKHLHFRGTIIDSENMASRPADDVDRTAISNIETLSLDVSWHSDRFDPKRIAFFQRLLLPVQSNLRRLVWTGFRGYITEDEIIIRANDFDAPAFPNLRSLTLDAISATDTTHIFRLFLDDNDTTRIRSLSMDLATQSSHVFLNTRGHIPSLKYLSLIGHDRGIMTYPYEVLKFLKANTQLEALHLGILTPHPTIDDQLMPLLRRTFTMLTSLQLTFDGSPRDGSPIPLDSLLRAISSLTALRRLWLSAGGSRDPRSWNWRVRHLDVVKFLTPLVNLELLAFSHDTYNVPMLHPLAPRHHGSGDYYSSMALPIDVERGIARYLTPEEYLVYQGRDGAHADYEVALDQQQKMRQQAWERWHAERMLEVVNCYAQSRRVLRWCFVGQLSFSAVDPDTQPNGSQFTAEWTKRDPTLISLREKMAVDVWCPV